MQAPGRCQRLTAARFPYQMILSPLLGRRLLLHFRRPSRRRHATPARSQRSGICITNHSIVWLGICPAFVKEAWTTAISDIAPSVVMDKSRIPGNFFGKVHLFLKLPHTPNNPPHDSDALRYFRFLLSATRTPNRNTYSQRENAFENSPRRFKPRSGNVAAAYHRSGQPADRASSQPGQPVPEAALPRESARS